MHFTGTFFIWDFGADRTNPCAGGRPALAVAVRDAQFLDQPLLVCHGAIVPRQSGGPLAAEPVVMADSGDPPLR